MKKAFVSLLTIVILAACSENSIGSGKKVELNDMKDSLSYCLGISLGNFLNTFDAEIDAAVFEQAIKDMKNKEELKISLEESNYVLSMIQNKMIMEAGIRNMKEGKDFLAENKKKEGVITTESGLQYEIVKEGNGPIPTKSDKVSVHYKGTFVNGDSFDSSYDRGEPIQFGVTMVIPGWTEALTMMPVGSKWKVYIPSELAYGSQPRGNIKPNSVLIFEMELLDIVKPDAATEGN